MQFSPWFLLPAASAVVFLALAALGWRRTATPMIVSFRVFCLTGAGYAAGQFFELALLDLAAKRLLSGLEYGLGTALPIAFVWFVLALTNRRAGKLTYALIPVVVLTALALTNPWHGWIWSSFEPAETAFATVRVTRGWLYYAGAFYSYGWILAGIVQVVLTTAQAPHVNGPRSLPLIVGALFPVIANVATLTSLVPVPLNLTPPSLALSGLAIGWLLFREQLLDLVPIGRTAAFDAMRDAVYVVDRAGRIVDRNAAALAIVGDGQLIGREIADLLPGIDSAIEMEIGGRDYDVEVAPLGDAADPVGRLIVLRDSTDRRALERRLAHEATTDALTGLANRRRFLDQLDIAVATAERTALISIDLDRFKEINDTRGHAAGDAVLRDAAQVLATACRSADLAARLGGDEFALLIDGAADVPISRIADAILGRLDRRGIAASIGVAVGFGLSADELLRRVDVALYAAKRGGRSRVVSWSPARDTAWVDPITSMRMPTGRDRSTAASR